MFVLFAGSSLIGHTFEAVGAAHSLAFFSPGWTEMVILGFIALLLFGKRLPEVARSFGQSFTEFKRGMTTIQSDVQSAVYSDPPPAPTAEPTNRIEADLRPTADKFQIEDEVESTTAKTEN